VRFLVKDDVPPNPMNVRFFGAPAVVTRSDRFANLIEELDSHLTTMASSSA
jgi:hypothetical protein